MSKEAVVKAIVKQVADKPKKTVYYWVRSGCERWPNKTYKNSVGFLCLYDTEEQAKKDLTDSDYLYQVRRPEEEK